MSLLKPSRSTYPLSILEWYSRKLSSWTKMCIRPKVNFRIHDLKKGTVCYYNCPPSLGLLGGQKLSGGTKLEDNSLR